MQKVIKVHLMYLEGHLGDDLLYEGIWAIYNSLIDDFQWIQARFQFGMSVWESDVGLYWPFLPFWLLS